MKIKRACILGLNIVLGRGKIELLLFIFDNALLFIRIIEINYRIRVSDFEALAILNI